MKKDRMVFNIKHIDREHRIWGRELYDLNFVFYPKESHMHGFNDKPPKDFAGVYKVYYSFAIEETKGSHPAESVFAIRCDECSALTYLADAIRHCIQKKTDSKALSPGQEGSIWELTYMKASDFPLKEEDSVIFSVWNNYTNKGYRFWLYVSAAKEFAGFIDMVNNHMLENGEPI